MSFKQRHTGLSQLGFSLIELLITMAISTLIVSAVLIRFDAFDSVVVLKSIAYEFALTVREAQVFAVSATGDTSGLFEQPYGIYVEMTNPQDYIFFEDTNGNRTYNSGTDVILETYSMNGKYEWRDLCVDTTSGQTCGLNSISMVFQRPEFDPTINTTGPVVANPIAARVQVGIIGDGSITFTTVVGLTGQISVESP